MIAFIGGFVVLVGLVLIPYPGPGWLIVFGGLAILATEFAWARLLLNKLHADYDNWIAWLKRQNMFVKTIVLALTGAIVLVTIWLLNGYGLMNNWLQLHKDWLISPLFR